MKEDKEFFDGRYRLFEVDGWMDLVEEQPRWLNL